MFYSILFSLTFIFLFGLPVAKANEAELKPFLGESVFHKQRLFTDQRYPNVVVSKKGTVLAAWGNSGVSVRSSEDGGKTWDDSIVVSEEGYNGGGTIVDNGSGDILVFVEDRQPPAPLTVYRSKDDGVTWKPEKTTIAKDLNGTILPCI